MRVSHSTSDLPALSRGPVLEAKPIPTRANLNSLHRHLHITGGQSIIVRQNQLLRPVVAEGGFAVAADDVECVEDVGGVFAREAVEVEVEGVEAGAQVAALLIVPDEGPCRGRYR